MARVTVEDCIDKVPNRFDLVMLAAQRAREIAAGSTLTVERDNDKNPVVALREIAEETVGVEATRQSLIQGLQKHVDFDEPEEDDVMELLEAESQTPGVVTELPSGDGETEDMSVEAMAAAELKAAAAVADEEEKP